MMWILAHFLFLFPQANAARVQHSYDPLKAVVDAGRRNLQWFKRVNQARSNRHLAPLELYSEYYGEGIVIETGQTPEDPERYNDVLLAYEFKQVLAQAPKAFVERITGQVPIGPDQGGLKDKTFLYWASTVGNINEMTVRWKLNNETLEDETKESVNDIRGYLALSRNPNIEATLREFGQQTPAVQKPIYKALLQLCRNSDKTIESCAAEFNSDPRSQNAFSFYQRYLPAGQKIWDQHFQISAPRTDVQWNMENPNVATLVFADPGNSQIRKWLKDSVESFWKWGDWQLKLAFKLNAGELFPHLQFEPGVTPTTDSTDNIITLDQNMPLDQDGLVTTVRHEFGHVLGFPDCYVEFYDTSEKMMVFYSLDQNNLMCTEGGKVLETHYQELKRVYYHE